jgi:hypothetical protein
VVVLGLPWIPHALRPCFKAPPPGRLLSFHSKEGDNEYMNIIANGLEGVNVVVFLTVGDDKKEGEFQHHDDTKYVKIRIGFGQCVLGPAQLQTLRLARSAERGCVTK